MSDANELEMALGFGRGDDQSLAGRGHFRSDALEQGRQVPKRFCRLASGVETDGSCRVGRAFFDVVSIRSDRCWSDRMVLNEGV